MIDANIQHKFGAWLPNLWTTPVQHKQSTRQLAEVQQIQLQPADFYYLNAGHYIMRVRAGRVWVAEVGIFGAGEQVRLTPGPDGLPIQAFPNQAVVFELRTA